MPKLISSLLLAAGLCGSLSANADAIYTVEAPLDFGISALGTPHQVAPGSFTDTINFTLGGPGNLVGGIESLDLNIGATSVFGISGLGMSLYTSEGVLLGSGSGFVVPNTQLAGNYYVNIFGTAVGSAGGMYAAALSVSPVPEPSTWGMMGLGIGVLGFAMSRRRKLDEAFS